VVLAGSGFLRLALASHASLGVLGVKMPVLRTDKLRRFVAILADAFRNHCAVFSSETFMIILVPGAEETSSAKAWLTRCNCGRLWKENRNDTFARAPSARPA